MSTVSKAHCVIGFLINGAAPRLHTLPLDASNVQMQVNTSAGSLSTFQARDAHVCLDVEQLDDKKVGAIVPESRGHL